MSALGRLALWCLRLGRTPEAIVKRSGSGWLWWRKCGARDTASMQPALREEAYGPVRRRRGCPRVARARRSRSRCGGVAETTRPRLTPRVARANATTS
jgi:hypothetical protein